MKNKNIIKQKIINQECNQIFWIRKPKQKEKLNY
jgi:hypothetical protein